jgi:hypothetical protein
MRELMLKVWQDDCGALIATEWVFVATILVLGSITGLVAVRQAVLVELIDMANAVMALNQTYSFTGQSNCQSSTAGSSFQDLNSSIFNGHQAAEETSLAGVLQQPCD